MLIYGMTGWQSTTGLTQTFTLTLTPKGTTKECCYDRQKARSCPDLQDGLVHQTQLLAMSFQVVTESPSLGTIRMSLSYREVCTVCVEEEKCFLCLELLESLEWVNYVSTVKDATAPMLSPLCDLLVNLSKRTE